MNDEDYSNKTREGFYKSGVENFVCNIIVEECIESIYSKEQSTMMDKVKGRRSFCIHPYLQACL
jgi:hypothetical protein